MRLYSTIIGVCWIAFWLYWIISAFGSKKGTRLNIRHFFVIRIALIVVAATLFSTLNKQPYSFQNRTVTSNEPVLILGLIMFLAGLTLAVWARIYLGKNWGMPMTQKKDPELVTSGPYRYIRHPIYSGILLAALGSAFAASIYWLLVFIIFAIYFIYSALVEEKLMMRQFPKVYPGYKSKTKMLIPFIL
jgi:protein-S-isoprenylcysteine O-methyltransferase Ste14